VKSVYIQSDENEWLREPSYVDRNDVFDVLYDIRRENVNVYDKNRITDRLTSKRIVFVKWK